MQKVTMTVQHDVAIIGAGPAGLMAAQVLSNAGVPVHIYDAMPSAGRKFLLAGIGGLNLSHSEPMELFLTRFYERNTALVPVLRTQAATQLVAWAKDLGVDTFVGSSGRIFPTDMKAAPLLRAWLQRLRSQGVQFHMRHRWTGWAASESGQALGALQFEHRSAVDAAPEIVTVQAKTTLLALGGASWPRLGSDGAWLPWLRSKGVEVANLLPANCGFDVHGWSPHFAGKYAGQPFKTVALSVPGSDFARQGEFVATHTGVEGSLIYAASKLLRERIAATGSATFHLDLLPQWDGAKVLREVSHPRGSRSLSSHLSSRLHLEGIKLNILYELLGKDARNDPKQLAMAIKALPITVIATRPLAEAISTAGGVRFEAMDAQYMLKALLGVFCAGEMLDWEAPTGGYLLTASMATGRAAGLGALAYINR
jgi:uncharacterized flavoprotein (TIGR03862 family)